eukprot:g2002.t1
MVAKQNLCVETIQGEVSYRLRRIEIKRAAAVDQIKFVFSDKTEFSIGNDGGRRDTRPVILMRDEYIKKVAHESFLNYKCAAAAVTFYTNRNRCFQYKPKELTTDLKREITIAEANNDMEIIGLDIRKGILHGFTQQKVPKGLKGRTFPKNLYAVVSYCPKEEDEDCPTTESSVEKSNNGIQVREFTTSYEAKVYMRKLKTLCDAKFGRVALFINVINRSVLDKAGKCQSSFKVVEDYAIQDGLMAEKDIWNFNMLNGLRTVFNLVNNREDYTTFGLVLLFLILNGLFETENARIQGNLLNILGNSIQAGGDYQFQENISVPYVQVTSNQNESYSDEINASYISKFLCYYTEGRCRTQSSQVLTMLFSLVFAKVVERMLYVLNIWVHHNACDIRNERMKVMCLQKALSLDMPFYDVHNMHEVRSGMRVNAVNNQLTWNLPYMLQRIFKLVIIGTYLLQINLEVGLILISGSVIFRYVVGRKLNDIRSRARKEYRKVEWMSDQIFNDALDMHQTIKVFSNEKTHLKKFEHNQKKKELMIRTIVQNRVIYDFFSSTWSTLLFAFVLFRVVRRQLMSNEHGNHAIPGGDLCSLFFFLQSFQQTLESLEWHYSHLKREYPYIEKFIRFHSSQATVKDGTQETNLFCNDDVENIDEEKQQQEVSTKICDDVCFLDTALVTKNANEATVEYHNISFEYPRRPGHIVLKNFSHCFRPGKITAIVGHSGGGKSTLMKLLMRLYDPVHGKITINDNIGYGATRTHGEEYSMEDVIVAAKRAQCYDFITKFRSGFHTFAGSKGGSQLSDGQKQRIAIARAAMRKESRILILDEATSSLDAENEELIQKALESLMKDKTIFIIAHRLSTIRNADEVICIDQGGLAEAGSHQELMGKKGIYYRLIQKQLLDPNFAEN